MDAPLAGSPLIARYTRLKNYASWLLLAFAIGGITLAIMTAISERTPVSALNDGQLGPHMAIAGKTIACPVIRDNLQEIIVSRDSGATFIRTGDRWAVTDTNLLIGIGPDSATIVAIDYKGTVHIMEAGDNHFRLEHPPISHRDSVRGFAFAWNKKAIYVYGNFPLRECSLTQGLTSNVMDDSLRILSLATGPNGNLLAIAHQPTTGYEYTYFLNSRGYLEPLGTYSLFPLSPNHSPIDSMARPRDTSAVLDNPYPTDSNALTPDSPVRKYDSTKK